MSGKRRTYTREFKLDAVRLLRESGKTPTEIAKDLGIDRSLLSNWKKEIDEAGPHAFPGNGHPGQELSEIRELKRRLQIAEEERDILKKALGFFAKERR
jgi:transposase